MKTTSLFIFMLLLAGVGLATLNWAALSQPGTISLGLTELQAPLGLVLLGLLALVAVYFLLLVATLQSQAALAARRGARELSDMRARADQAEASRLAELRALLETGLRTQGERQDQATASLVARIDKLEADLNAAMKSGENSLSAHLGEIEDRVERGFGGKALPEGH